MKLAPIQTAQLFDPDDNFPIRAEDYIPDLAIDPTNGDIYVGCRGEINQVVMRKSTDGRRDWTTPTVVANGA